jgi:hypothetical protein
MVAKLLGKKGKMTKQLSHFFVFLVIVSLVGSTVTVRLLQKSEVFLWGLKRCYLGSEPKNKMENQDPGSQSGSGTLAISREPMYRCFN